MRVSSFIAFGVLSMSVSSQAQELKPGGVYGCAGMPQFIRSTGLQQPVAIDTSISRLPGVVLRELRGQQRVYQKESWKTTGHVGSTVRDAQGSIYAVPIPSVALDTNPLSKRNTVYRIRSDSGELETFVGLPLPENESQRNPFGAVGLALDCETNSLYVSSVAGSSATEVAGAIYQLDLATGKILDTWEGVDALGIAIYNSASGKKLYYGDARSSSLYTLDLKMNGRFSKGQASRYALSLLGLKNGDSTQIRKIRFSTEKNGLQLMTLDDTEFAYRPAAETARQYKKYIFAWNAEKKAWSLLSIQLN